MNKDIKKRWVKALRSGDYSQCKGKLHNGVGFCCLGVLTDIYLKETNQKWDITERGGSIMASRYSFKNDSKLLSQPICDWSGITIDSPGVWINGQTEWLTNLNDNDSSFEQIAAWIENDTKL